MQTFAVTRLLAESEQAAAQAFLDRLYHERYGIGPGPSQNLFGAINGAGTLVGTFGMEVPDEHYETRLDQIYEVTPAAMPLPFDRQQLVECGRWAVTQSVVSPALMLCFCAHALAQGRRYGWCEHRSTVHRVARTLGVTFLPVGSAAVLRFDQVVPAEQQLYTTGDPPQLYMFDVAAAAVSLQLQLNRHQLSVWFDQVTYDWQAAA